MRRVDFVTFVPFIFFNPSKTICSYGRTIFVALTNASSRSKFAWLKDLECGVARNAFQQPSFAPSSHLLSQTHCLGRVGPWAKRAVGAVTLRALWLDDIAWRLPRIDSDKYAPISRTGWNVAAANDVSPLFCLREGGRLTVLFSLSHIWSAVSKRSGYRDFFFNVDRRLYVYLHVCQFCYPLLICCRAVVYFCGCFMIATNKRCHDCAHLCVCVYDTISAFHLFFLFLIDCRFSALVQS